MIVKIISRSKNFFNNGYEYFSAKQEQALVNMGLGDSVVRSLDKSLWATLFGDPVSAHLTVLEAAEIAVVAEEYKKLPLIKILKNSLKNELGIIC